MTGLRRLLSRVGSRLNGEEGIALVAVMGVMGVLLLITAWVATGSEQLSTTTNADRDAKRALAAAEAGLAVATERLARMTLLPEQCLTNEGASTVGTGECTPPTTTVSLGNNTSYRFLVSREVSGTTGCATGQVPVGKERCITAVGRANGVERRLLRLIQTGAPMFGEAGIVGLDSLFFDNSNELKGTGNSVPLTLGTNGDVTMVNSNVVNGTFHLPASAVINSTSSSTGWTRTTRDAAWELLDVGYAIDRAWASNQNGTLSSSVYDSTTKRLYLANDDVTTTIGGGTYVFCEFYAFNSAKLNISSGQTAKIYVDSPLRAGSPCPAPTSDKRGRGRLILHNSVELNLNGAAPYLQFVVAGTGDEANNPAHICPDNKSYFEDVVLCNSVKMNGTVYAPRSEIKAVNSVEVGGGLAGRDVSFINSIKFTQPAGLGSLTLDTFRNRRWYECKRNPSVSSDPESGCTAP